MSMQQIDDIAAPIAIVWELTVDIEGWPQILPTVDQVTRLDPGPLTVGSRARVEQPGRRPAVWTVTELDQPRTFTWVTQVGWITIEARHQLEPTPAGTRNTLGIEMRGLGARLTKLAYGAGVRRTLALEGTAFRAVAEANSREARELGGNR